MKKTHICGHRMLTKPDPIMLLYDLFIKVIETRDYDSMKALEDLADMFQEDGHKELRSYVFSYFIRQMQENDMDTVPGLDAPDLIVPHYPEKGEAVHA